MKSRTETRSKTQRPISKKTVLPVVTLTAGMILMLMQGAFAQLPYQDGFTESLYMGHSFFAPGRKDIEILAPYCGYARHTQKNHIRGGNNGSPGAIWRSVADNEYPKTLIQQGNIEILGLTMTDPARGDSDYEDYVNWVDYTLQYNAGRFDTLFIQPIWGPHSYTGTYAANRAMQDQVNGYIYNILDQLRVAYPQLTCLMVPVGEGMTRLWQLYDQGQLGPEIQGVFILDNYENALQRDTTGHAGNIFEDLSGLIWLQTIYPETDIRTVSNPPTYQYNWTYDLRQLAYDIVQNEPYAHRYLEGDGDGDGGFGEGTPVTGAIGLGLVAAACALGGSMFLRKK